MHAIPQITKSSRRAPIPEVLDARIFVRARGYFAGDGNPVLRGAILEGELSGLVILQVGEFVAVGVG